MFSIAVGRIVQYKPQRVRQCNRATVSRPTAAPHREHDTWRLWRGRTRQRARTHWCSASARDSGASTSGLDPQLSLEHTQPAPLLSRRKALLASSTALTLSSNLLEVPEARALVVLPQRLRNRYIMVRHGESELDVAGVIQSNPGFKYDVQWGLTDRGRQQMHDAAEYIEDELDAAPSWIYTSNFQRAFQSALILRADLNLLFSNFRTEFSGLLDPRKMGSLEGRPMDSRSQVWANDRRDIQSTPPAMSSMQPAGSVDSCVDLYRRATEAISRLEGTYSGLDIICVSHEDTLSTFTAAMMGTPLASHHQDWPYALGQVRMVDLTQIDPADLADPDQAPGIVL